jgi:hypothetical protein
MKWLRQFFRVPQPVPQPARPDDWARLQTEAELHLEALRRRMLHLECEFIEHEVRPERLPRTDE